MASLAFPRPLLRPGFMHPVLVVALACFLLPSTFAPALGWGSIGAWSPTHSHVTVGGPVPPHTYPWESGRDSNKSDCAATGTLPRSDRAAARVACTADPTVDGFTSSLFVPAAMFVTLLSDLHEVLQRGPAIARWSDVIAPIPLPPPID